MPRRGTPLWRLWPGLLCLMAPPCPASPVKPVAAARAQAPALGQPAPAFILPDIDGHRRSLASFRGRPVALFFFCDCPRCHAVAQAWAEAQGDVGTGRPPRTVIVFSDAADAARAFATETGLPTGAEGVTLLTDPEERVTDRYRIAPCPRVFILDAAGRVRDTNPDPNAPALEIVSRALTALRRLPAPPKAAHAAL